MSKGDGKVTAKRFGSAVLQILFLFGAALTASVGDARSAPPRLIYYLHGKIVEDAGPRGVSPRFGPYDYPGILEALRRDGATVESEVRPQGTDAGTYADRIVADIRSRIASGVPASRITVIGASKGSVIASIVSTRLREPRVRYVLLANCNDWLIREVDPRLTGEILSIYERSDELSGSCNAVVARSPGVTRYREIALTTGLGHGMVYRPLREWVRPALEWSRR